MAMVSHELKTPLTVVKANLQILTFSMIADPNMDLIGRSLKQVNKLSDLVINLLDISKIQAGKLEINISLFDMNILLREVINNIQQTTLVHTIHFSENKEKLFGNGDSSRIDQVIVNILANAIKYSPDSQDIIVDAYKNDGKNYSQHKR